MTALAFLIALVFLIAAWDGWTVYRERRESRRARAHARAIERAADESLAAGIRLGLAAGTVQERQRIFEALTTDTAEHPAVNPDGHHLRLIHQSEAPDVTGTPRAS